jgi:rubrerythrin
MLTYATLPPTQKPLNFALLLESAQSQFYDQLLARLTEGLRLPPQSTAFAQTLQQVEHDHRDLLSTTLATDALTPPTFNFKLETLNRNQALALALELEQTTARAYLGLIGRLDSLSHATLLTSLQGTESRHVAILTALTNSLFHQTNSPTSPTPAAREPALNPDAALRFLSRYELT